MTVLSVARDVAALVGLDQPDMLYNTDDRTALELLNIVRDAAEHVVEAHDWDTLAFAAADPLPLDFSHWRHDGLYQSGWYAIDASGVRKPAFTADDDRFALPERLLRLCAIWKWKATKGLPYGQDFEEFERARVLAQTRRDPVVIGRARGIKGLVSTWVNVDVDWPNA